MVLNIAVDKRKNIFLLFLFLHEKYVVFFHWNRLTDYLQHICVFPWKNKKNIGAVCVIAADKRGVST